MLLESHLHFAREALSRLQEVVSELCSHANPPYHQFCNEIQTTLFCFIPRLGSLPDTELESFQDEVSDFLSDLDKLCQPRISTEAIHLPTESGLGNTGFALQYPALALLLKDASSAREAIKTLASSDKHVRARRRLVKRLEDYRGGEPDNVVTEAFSSLSSTVVQAENGAPPECGREILLLHSTLSTYCFCINDEPHRSTAACVRLSSSNPGESKVTFGVLFMDHPHEHTAENIAHPWWQDTEISLYRTVQTKGSQPGGSTRRRAIGLGSTQNDSFCYWITHQKQRGPMLLHFSVTNAPDRDRTAERGFFMDRFESYRPRRWDVERPSISLRDLLETVAAEDFSEKKKEVLSVFLAKAVWQYYSSPWMATPWTKDSVHFLLEQRCTSQNEELAGIFVDEPLLLVSISAPTSVIPKLQNQVNDADDFFGSEDPVFSFQATHQLPKILALGVMLMEIQLGRPIESLYTDAKYSHHYPRGVAYLDTDYNICKDLIEKEHIYTVKDTSDPLSKLITNCILPKDSFMPPRVRSLSDDDIRPALYNLVSQLELWNSARQPHNVRPLNLPSGTPSTWTVPVRLSPAPPHSDLEHPDEELRRGRVMAQITNSKTTEDWLSRMRSLVHVLKPQRQDKYDKVKVAVLDTGVDPTQVEADYIEDYVDFVGGQRGGKCDNTGHGTTSIRLIFDMCESAEVYALRVFENDTAANGTQKLAIAALDWCIANKIDVVCMAFGFTEHDETLRRRIKTASDTMLLFAAPTNEGNKHNILYPALYSDFVVPVFATDGKVKSSDLNPSSGPAKHNFAILGEDIKDVYDVVNSGTSYSTAIAAGFAARLLDFSRHGDAESQLGDKAQELKTKDGFTGVLLSMALNTIDDLYHCVRPWDLLPKDLRSLLPFQAPGLSEERTAYARHKICQKMLMGIDREFG